MFKNLFKPHKEPTKTNTEAIEAALEENRVLLQKLLEAQKKVCKEKVKRKFAENEKKE